MSMNLEGLRVIELTHWVAGPLAGQILGEWGADVIHVERAGTGDVTRGNGPFYQGESLYYGSFNRDKRSISLDITKSEGLEILLQLIETADVFITNYTASYLERCGLNYDVIKARNPKVIACYISAFGLYGRYKDKKALDMVMQAMSGQMACNGDPDGIPFKTGTITGDYNGAYQAVQGILIALWGREHTGEGQLVDVAITDALICGLEWRIVEQRLTGKTCLRTGNRRPTVAPCNLYPAKDGYVYIAASSQKMYEGLARLIGDERLNDERFANNTLRVQNVEELEAIICSWLKDKSCDWLVPMLEKAGVPNGPLNTPMDLANGDYVDEKDLVIEVEDPVLGKIPMMGTPIKMSSGYRSEHRGAPKLGQHNREIYQGLLNWSDEKLHEMAEAGLI